MLVGIYILLVSYSFVAEVPEHNPVWQQPTFAATET